MLLRNMDPSRGHCNGTRYIDRQISRRYITAETACSEYAGNVLLIPQIPLLPTDAGLPLTIHRRQFPLPPAIAITINKAQGHMLQRVGMLLDKPLSLTDNCTSRRRVVVIHRGSDSMYRTVKLSMLSTKSCCQTLIDVQVRITFCCLYCTLCLTAVART